MTIGFVYFVQAGDGGPIKIGWSRNPPARLKELRTASPYHLRMLHHEPGDMTRERELHAAMGHIRIRGEWFWPASDLLLCIRQLRARGL